MHQKAHSICQLPECENIHVCFKSLQVMNEKQRLALSRAIEGHNLLLLGQSGTGKSFTVEHIHSGLTEKGKCNEKNPRATNRALSILS